ncbi:unnamed protein product [Bemisia tabaci]|uniref:Uncharacterized protein n=1 Tax=Bemisia tabaci TaxID=7038 RepID=A0A9P0FAJ2_BEMTA|nr:unnamed protein product [Bemisia tabaci]
MAFDGEHGIPDFEQPMSTEDTPQPETSAGEENQGNRQVLHPQTREFVFRLIQHFEEEKKNGGPLMDVAKVLERTASALRIGLCTVKRIKKEGSLAKRRNKNNACPNVSTYETCLPQFYWRNRTNCTSTGSQ